MTEALEHRRILELMGAVDGTRVLDLGCGDGLLTATLATQGARAVGIDIDRTMLRAAVARTMSGQGERAQFVEGRIERLPFPDAVFDVVSPSRCCACYLTRRSPYERRHGSCGRAAD